MNYDNNKYDLNNKKVAILVTNGFEQVEFTKPLKALKDAGATVHVIAPESGKVRAWNSDNWGESYNVDITLDEADASNYDSLMLPGGVMNPDQLRMNNKAISFIKSFFTAGKPISAICHAPWLLIETDALKGRTLTSYPSLRTDLENAGATWKDQEVVVDEGLTTSRKPEDIPAFIEKMLEEISEGKHAGQQTVEA
ncbi:type 1 glutamine amidotransferase [Cryomorpha ignava]|uniref:Type 1 glutamine amidotransferase n=1 Tax=Cryomorpha ignava TaxID=101383 RepID=A0A7K3WS85_9FLAO|nr:type 1 glutamine amidotransferase domain-containing protein [Cryomorpha ignava]NEN23921.1 type 1 glutamine amidotransferase [Cryomorpha ignava]